MKNKDFEEIQILGLNAFSRMLGMEKNLNDLSLPAEITEIQIDIKTLLDAGAVCKRSVAGFTPLMLYVFFHILDYRFQAELDSGQNITETVHLSHKPFWKNYKVNALFFAVVSKNVNVEGLKQLLATHLFDKEEDYELAVEVSAWLGVREAVSIFFRNGFNLSTPS